MADDDAYDMVLEAEARGLYDKPVAKGTCRHCGKVIGRRVLAHEKQCKAKP